MQARAAMVLVYVPIGMKEQIVELSKEQNFWGHIQVMFYSPILIVPPKVILGT
jgi:hypothetical protein